MQIVLCVLHQVVWEICFEMTLGSIRKKGFDLVSESIPDQALWKQYGIFSLVLFSNGNRLKWEEKCFYKYSFWITWIEFIQ